MSYEAEQNVIAALLINPNALDTIYGRLTEDMFTSDILRHVYVEFLKAYDNHYDINMTVIAQKLEGHIPHDELMNELRNCAMCVSDSTGIKTYARVIINDYKSNRLRNILSESESSVLPDNINSQIGRIISQLEALQETKSSTSKTLAEIAKENKDKYFTDSDDNKRIYIGFPKLDDILGSLEGGDMIVIGARPAVGKSAFVTQVCVNLAKQKKRIGFYNLEMQEKQVYERFVVSLSGLSLTRLRRAKRFLGDEKERFEKVNTVLECIDSIVINTGGRTVSEIRAESRHMGYDVIIIDYMQLLSAEKTYRGNRTAEVGEISRAIKNLAMELNIPIIALSQLNRVSAAQNATSEPSMSELREAGNIEQDASVIMLMWNISADGIKKGCKVEKQRQGQTGKMVMRFNGDLMRFEETNESVKEAQENTKNSRAEESPFD
ncbi:MAG: AAA family ATPase [Clostridia bacterium]|jgi:replicative DNA helicase|nr:AAA family ATPase [Clostridia bacterium]